MSVGTWTITSQNYGESERRDLRSVNDIRKASQQLRRFLDFLTSHNHCYDGKYACKLAQAEHKTLPQKTIKGNPTSKRISKELILKKSWEKVYTIMQLSHCVVCMLNSSCNIKRVEATEFAKQHMTCEIKIAEIFRIFLQLIYLAAKLQKTTKSSQKSFQDHRNISFNRNLFTEKKQTPFHKQV